MITKLKNDKKIIYSFVFGMLLFLFLALASKNPFNDKSQIPNMEPFPDALLYSLPAWNWISGNGWNIKSFGLEANMTVPKFYGITMLPFMKLFNDIRGFYFGNVLLTLFTFLFLMLTVFELIKISKFKSWIAGLIGFYFVTNFYVYTQPQLFMTENLTNLLIVIFFYLLLLPVSIKQSLLSLITLWLIFLVKLTNLPISLILFVFFGLRLFVLKVWIIKNIRLPVVGLGVLTLGILMYFLLKRWGPYLMTDVFGFKYLNDNFKFYFDVVTGGNNRFLWYFNPLYTRDILVLTLSGLIVGLMQKNRRWYVLSIIILAFSFMVTMSFFMMTEGRHVSFIFPLLLIMATLSVEKLVSKFGWIVLPLLFVITLLWPVTNDNVSKIVAIKRQIGLNLKYREDPWNYLAIMEFNKFFVNNNSNVYFGTMLPPFYVDLFDNGNYKYLPITKIQEFPYIWDKKYVEKTMIPIYSELLKNNNKVYVSNYYINNSQNWKRDYIELISNFDNKLVWQSPLDNCNVYELSLKKQK